LDRVGGWVGFRPVVDACVCWAFELQGKGHMNTYWLVGEKDDPNTAAHLKELLREARKYGKQLRHAL